MSISIRATNRAPFAEVRYVEAAPGPETAGAVPMLDLGEIRLPEGLAIAGRIRSTAKQLPEKTVVHVSVGRIHEVVSVGPDGSFRCAGLPEGRLNLRVNAPGHEVLLVTEDAGNEEIDLVITAVSTLDIRIVRPGDEPIDGWLSMKPVGGQALNRSAAVRPIKGKVDSYQFERLAAGTYRLSLQAGDRFARTIVSVGHGETREATLTLERGATVRGSVTLPDGNIARATGVNLDLGEEWGSISRVTDAEGRFEFRGVPTGKLLLKTHPMGYAPTSKAIEATPGAEVDVKLVLRSGGRVEVRVRDAADQPVAGVHIALSRPDGSPARYWIQGGVRARTGEDGTVTLTGIEPGEYSLSLFRTGTPRPWGKVLVEENGTLRVDATWK